MVDALFFDNCGPFSVEEIAKITGAKIYLDGNELSSCSKQIESVAPLEIATSSDLSFLSNKKYITALAQSKAGVCVVAKDCLERIPNGMIALLSPNPYRDYAIVARTFFPNEYLVEHICDRAIIDNSAHIGAGCNIASGVVIGQDVIIGNNCKIGANTVIERGVVIGNNCRIAPNATISHAIIGDDVIIHPNVSIGQDGFGFAFDGKTHIKVPQLGRVIIGSSVEIGAGSCIDRGSSHDTIIGDGCKLDNLVQIAHNVQIGPHSIIVAQVGISGSTKIGKHAVIGGQAGIVGHLDIGDKVQIAAQSGVLENLESGAVVGGTPSMPIKKWHRQTIMLKKMLNLRNKESHEDK